MKVLCLFIVLISIAFCKKEEELPKDVLCAGCEAVVKALSGRLSYNSKDSLEKDVPKVLRTICDEQSYKDTEFSPSKVRAACLQLLKKQKTDIKNVLVEYYSKRVQSKSYLDLLPKICTETTGVCSRQSDDGKPAEGRVIFNDETQEFEVVMGENVRMPHPTINEKHVVKSKAKKMAADSLHASTIKPMSTPMSGHDEL